VTAVCGGERFGDMEAGFAAGTVEITTLGGNVQFVHAAGQMTGGAFDFHGRADSSQDNLLAARSQVVRQKNDSSVFTVNNRIDGIFQLDKGNLMGKKQYSKSMTLLFGYCKGTAYLCMNDISRR
jgi:hypothetical protein